jgi:hypothetical protein
MAITADLLLNILSRADRRAIKETGDDLDKTARKADDTGKSFRGLGDDTRRLDADIEKSRARIVELGKEFERTGEKTAGFKKQLSSERSNLAWLEKLKKDLVAAGEEGGQGLVAGLSKNLTGFATDHKVAVAIAGAIVAGAPVIGAAASAAVLAGLGGGTLAAGIALAAKDSRVAGAFESMFSDLTDELEKASSVFIAPLQRAAEAVGKDFADILPDIRRDFELLAPVVDELVNGLGGFVRNIMPGFDHGIEAAVPLLDQIAAELPGLGRSIGTFFDQISQGGPGAIQFLHDFSLLLDVNIAGSGWLLGNLSKIYAVMSGIARLSVGDVAGAITLWDQFGDHSATSFQKIQTTADAAGAAFHDTATAIADANQKMRDWVSEALGMQDSDLALKGGLLDIAEAFKASNGGMDTSNRLGLAAREALQGQIDKIAERRQKMLDQKLAFAYVDGWTRTQIQSALDDAAAHGANKDELAKLRAEWEAMLRLSPDKTLTTTVKTVFITEGQSPPPAAQRFGHVAYASGGKVPGRAGGGLGGGFFDVGENGRERVFLPADAYVMPNNRMSAGAGGPAEAAEQTIRIRLEYPDGRVVRDLLLRHSNQYGIKSVEQLLPIGR